MSLAPAVERRGAPSRGRRGSASPGFGERLQRDLHLNGSLYLLVLPVLAYYIVFHYYPLYGAQIAFKRFIPTRGIWGSEWIGFQHFRGFFSSHYFARILTSTLIISVVSLVVICGIVREFTRDDGAVTVLLSHLGIRTGTMLSRPQLWSITLPGILPTVMTLLVLRMGRMLNVGYEKIILLYSPAIYETADVMSSFVYRKGLIDLDFSYSSAVGLCGGVVNLTLLVSVATLYPMLHVVFGSISDPLRLIQHRSSGW